MAVETQVSESEAPETAAGASRFEQVADFCHRTSSARSPMQFWQAVADHFQVEWNAELVEIRIDNAGSSREVTSSAGDESRDTWHRLTDAMRLQARRADSAQWRVCELPGVPERSVVSLPLKLNGLHSSGAVAVVVAETDEAALPGLAHELETLIHVACCQQQASRSTSQSADQAGADGVTRAAQFDSITEFAFAITNGLKNKLGIQEAALGMVDGSRVRLESVSGLDSTGLRTPGAQDIEAAMAECLDLGRTVRQSESISTDGPTFELHDLWLDETRSGAVASIPLMANDECVAIISLRATDAEHLSGEQICKAEKLAQPLATGLLLLRKANQPIAMRIARQARESVQRIQPGSRIGQGIALMAGVAALWFAFGSVDYTVHMPCEVVAENAIEVAAPFAGRIASAHVKPGATIKAGEILVEFDTRELRGQLAQAEAEFDIGRVELNSALAEKDVAAAGQARARMERARLQVELHRTQIAKAIIRANEDGVVLRGDVDRRVGESVAMGTPLLEIAPEDGVAVDIFVGESSAPHVAARQQASFVLNARPSATIEASVDRVEPSSEIVAGKNVFRTRALPVSSEATWLRPGMTGFASVNTGSKRVWWVWLHRPLNWLRMQAWGL